MSYGIAKQAKFNPENPAEITTETRYIDQNGTISETPPQLDLFNNEEGDKDNEARRDSNSRQ